MIRDRSFWNKELWNIKHVLDSMRHMQCSLYANYEKSYLSKAASKNKHLTDDKRDALHTIITKYECLFNRNLGTWKTKSIDIELHPDTKSYHAKAYPVPQEHEYLFKK